jgi:hypothetical protein
MSVRATAALSFVISTGAPKERSGEICGFPRKPKKIPHQTRQRSALVTPGEIRGR